VSGKCGHRIDLCNGKNQFTKVPLRCVTHHCASGFKRTVRRIEEKKKQWSYTETAFGEQNTLELKEIKRLCRLEKENCKNRNLYSAGTRLSLNALFWHLRVASCLLSNVLETWSPFKIGLRTECFEFVLSIKLYELFYTQYNTINNANISITPSPHDMFRPQTAIITCLSYAKTVSLYRMSTFHIIYNCDISWFKIFSVIIDF
jgi:hypothetical protein